MRTIARNAQGLSSSAPQRRASVVEQSRAEGLDELRLWVHATFALADTVTLASGIVVLTYRTS